MKQTLPVSMSTLAAVVVCCASLWAQRMTIPELVRFGETAQGSSPPFGPGRSFDDILPHVDMVVRGVAGAGSGRLSDDQMQIFTDYPILQTTILYPSDAAFTSRPGESPVITVSQLGGSARVNGVVFSQSVGGLEPLVSGTEYLFLLQRVGKHLEITETYFGAFQIKGGRLAPLAGQKSNFASNFAPEYRNVDSDQAVAQIAQRVRAAKR